MNKRVLKRFDLYIYADQKAVMEEIFRLDGVKPSEQVRRAIDAYIKAYKGKQQKRKGEGRAKE